MVAGTWCALDGSARFKKPRRFQQLVGSLLYPSNMTRPDTTFATDYLSRQSHKPTVESWRHTIHVTRNWWGTFRLNIIYKRDGNDRIIGYSDPDWEQHKLDRTSICKYTFILAGGVISWRSKNQYIVAQNTVKADYIALAIAIRKALWFETFTSATKVLQSTFDIYIKKDNLGCISLEKHNMVSDRSKHIDIIYQFTVDNIQNKKTYRLCTSPHLKCSQML